MRDIRQSLPNAITLARLLLAVVFFVAIAGVSCQPGEDPGRAWFAVWVFIVAAVSDVLDGYLARRWKTVSPFGRILDPVVDKILVIGGLVFLIAPPFSSGSGIVPWMVVVVIGRELLVTSVRAVIEAQGTSFPADWGGKFKMLVQCVAVPVCFGNAAIESKRTSDTFNIFAEVMVWLMIVVTVSSAFPVLARARRHFRGSKPAARALGSSR
ncbi:MAG: CDP-diacylglycerol--glycerol-3-phosphate 3-phosphatidyltransferase [Phycisphaerales bacterium]|nr:CDP-diacylglycerol--glycerol-3-phosphate 3-phosphatidyltransferase [Phycisphaerales bacterium]